MGEKTHEYIFQIEKDCDGVYCYIKQGELIRCGACIHFQCNMRCDGSVPKGADAYECRRGCGGCDPMDYCSYGERAERRTDD